MKFPTMGCKVRSLNFQNLSLGVAAKRNADPECGSSKNKSSNASNSYVKSKGGT